MKTIKVSDEVYDYLKGMIDDEHVANVDSSPEINENGEACAYRPTFSEVISHLIEDRELATVRWQITDERVEALWHAIKVLKENDIMEEPEEHLWDEEVTVLQAMMKEADHDKP